MKLVLTGAGGFLGHHIRARLQAMTGHEVIPVDRGNWASLRRLAKGVGAIIHVAGINRGEPIEVEYGNVALAEDVAAAVQTSGCNPTIVFANSIHAGNNTPYGAGKARAASLLAAAAERVGSIFVDVQLPNLFGENGRPDYNSFVASFTRAVVESRSPAVQDRSVELMHAQAAAQVLLNALDRTTSAEMAPRGTPTTVRAVLDQLLHFHKLYLIGDLPPLVHDFDIDLFNTLRAALFPQHYPITLAGHTDGRGSLTEVVRSHGGQGQTFVSTTKPGITRGQHFHLRKIERFVVIGGQARISLRQLFTSEVVHFDVDGKTPAVVDMPTLWAHNITNIGKSDLTTIFWTHELFDPAAPDTFAETVLP